MKIYRDVPQGSAEWFKLRMKIPTASCFDQIVTPKTGQLSKSSVKYAYKLLTERLLNQPTDSVEGMTWMDRGKELEPEAVRQFEFVEDIETEAVSFITTDDGSIGASPDRLIKGSARGVEIKCPAPWTHLGYLLDGQADAYRAQVQGQNYVGELEASFFYSFHPRMPACRIFTPRDEPYIALLTSALAEFNEQLLEMERRARAMGLFQAYVEAVTPADVERADQLLAETQQPVLDAIDDPGAVPIRYEADIRPSGESAATRSSAAAAGHFEPIATFRLVLSTGNHDFGTMEDYLAEYRKVVDNLYSGGHRRELLKFDQANKPHIAEFAGLAEAVAAVNAEIRRPAGGLNV